MKLLRINDVMQKTGVKKTTIYRLVKNNQFPKPVKIGSASVLLHSNETKSLFEIRSGLRCF